MEGWCSTICFKSQVALGRSPGIVMKSVCVLGQGAPVLWVSVSPSVTWVGSWKFSPVIKIMKVRSPSAETAGGEPEAPCVLGATGVSI